MVELEITHALSISHAVVAGIFRTSGHSFVILVTFADDHHNLITQYAHGEVYENSIHLGSWVDLPRPETVRVNDVFHVYQVTESEMTLKVLLDLLE